MFTQKTDEVIGRGDEKQRKYEKLKALPKRIAAGMKHRFLCENKVYRYTYNASKYQTVQYAGSQQQQQRKHQIVYYAAKKRGSCKADKNKIYFEGVYQRIEMRRWIVLLIYRFNWNLYYVMTGFTEDNQRFKFKFISG